MDIIKSFNDQKGRFNRYKFWIYTLIMQVIFIVISLILTFLGNMLDLNILIQLGTGISGLGILYITFTSYIKRLHDLDKSGWMSLLIFVPFANLYLFIICGFFKGTDGPNKFGPDPLGGTGVQSTGNTPNEL